MTGNLVDSTAPDSVDVSSESDNDAEGEDGDDIVPLVHRRLEHPRHHIDHEMDSQASESDDELPNRQTTNTEALGRDNRQKHGNLRPAQPAHLRVSQNRQPLSRYGRFL
jgi:hypothetical protein